MSKTSYYYDPPESLNIVYAPGECCDYCGKLSHLTPAGEMVPMPMTDIDEEYGHEEGDIHMHEGCALEWVEKARRELNEAEAALRSRGLLK